MQAADYHFLAGSLARSQDLIQSALAACQAGPHRVPLLLRLATVHCHLSGWPLAEETFRQAASEAHEDPALRAHAEQELAFARVVAGDLPAALSWAKASLRSAEQAADPRLTAHSPARIAVLEFLRANGVRLDLLDRAEALDASAGEEPTGRLPFLLHHFSELECWAGNWDTAEEYAREGCRVAGESRQQTMMPATLYCLALVCAHRGQVVQAREHASRALVLCEQTGNVPVASQVLSVLGFAALSLDDHQAAAAHLDHLAETTAVFGLGEPGVVKFLPDEIEALAVLGQFDRAWWFTRQLEARGKSLGRPWALASGARCHAQLAAIGGDLQGAQAACEQALSEHEQLPMRSSWDEPCLSRA